jgi:hypothetical protein
VQTSQHSRNQLGDVDEPASDFTSIQRVQRRSEPRRLPLEALDYYLFNPRRTHDPLLEQAYEVWREGWLATLFELDGTTKLYSDEFARQDEIAVMAFEGRCIAVNGLRWLDLSLPRSLEDSYFKHWPAEAQHQVAGRSVIVGSNTLVDPAWRGARIELPRAQTCEPVRLSFATIALTIRRFVASSADSLLALTRNDRAIDRTLGALGATCLARIQLHGIDTDVVCIERANARPEGAVVNDLWRRRHQA